MIKNIVFDMGNVLVSYDGMRVCEHYIENEHDRKVVFNGLFLSPEWIYLDMGVMSEEQAMKQICARLPECLREKAFLCMRDWHLYNMQTVQEMEPVIRSLKAKGYGIYLCSNASMRLPACYKDYLPALDCFDGILFSAEEKCIKPQKEIYERFFGKFGLKPEECFFIDDLQLNIDGAKACGMDGYCFADRDIGKLKEVLEQLKED